MLCELVCKCEANTVGGPLTVAVSESCIKEDLICLQRLPRGNDTVQSSHIPRLELDMWVQSTTCITESHCY